MSWQDEFRQLFPITRDKAYANIAYTSPLSPKVADAVAQFFEGITHARSDKPQWLRDADALRVRLARLIGGDARRLAFTKNTTEGLNTVAQGLPWQPGDNLVVDDQEHPTNALPWLNLRRHGVQVRVAGASSHRYTVDDLWQHVDARTRLIAVSWVQYGTGLRTDIAELGRRCAQRGIWLVVDGIQGAGLLRARVDEWQVDAFASGAHKGMLGPLGVGLLHVSEKLLDALDPLYVGPSGVTTLDKSGLQWQVGVADAGDARRLDLIEGAGPDRIEPWVLELSHALHGGLRAQGVAVVSPSDPELRSTTTALRVADPAGALAHLTRAGVVASVVEYGYVRLSVGAYNNHADIDRILSATRALAA